MATLFKGRMRMQAAGATEEGAQKNPAESGMSLVGGSSPMEQTQGGCESGRILPGAIYFR